MPRRITSSALSRLAGRAFADEGDPLQIFRHRTGAYVYFGARVNQSTLVKGDTFSGMVERIWPSAGGGKCCDSVPCYQIPNSGKPVPSAPVVGEIS